MEDVFQQFLAENPQHIVGTGTVVEDGETLACGDYTTMLAFNEWCYAQRLVTKEKYESWKKYVQAIRAHAESQKGGAE